MIWYLEEMALDKISVDKMSVFEMSCYHPAAMVLLGERGIQEGESRKGKKRKNSKIAFSLFFG